MAFVLISLGLIAYLVLFPLLLAGARQRIRILEQAVASLERAVRTLTGPQGVPERPDTHRREAVVEARARPPIRPAPPPPDTPSLPEQAPHAVIAHPEPEVAPGRGDAWRSPRPAESEPAPGPAAGVLVSRATAWLFSGNTVARVGVIILFFGVAFFLKYASERGWLPIELRLAAAALSGMLLLGIGWRQREPRRGYGLVLQGGGMGIAYLTVFTAVDMYHLLPAGPGLVLMVVLVVIGSALAVLQDARSLAVLAMVGGFLAPVLISRGGSHVQLFAYYAVLDAGILAIAWHKAWRELNLVGFVFTFVIGGAWGYSAYQPAYFATTEPFLALYFLLYVAVPILFAERQPPRLKGYVDSSLVFGVPLVAFGLQSTLVRDFEYGVAWSALAAGLFYAVLAAALWRRRRDDLRLLTEVFIALAVAFGTLAIPLAVDGRWTGAAWALEGAAMVWVGLRQRRMLARAFGLLVQAGAGVSFLASTGLAAADTPVLNSLYLGALMVSLAGLFSAWQLDRHREALSESERGLSASLLAWGLVWWYGAGIHEIWRHGSWGSHDNALLGLVTASSVVLSLLGRRLGWTDLARPPLLLLPAMVITALVQLLFQSVPHPMAHWGWAAWGAAFVAHYWLLRRHEADWSGELPGNAWHSITLWLAVFLVVREGQWLIGQAISQGPTWRDLVPELIPAAVILGLPRLAERLSWPLRTFKAAYLDRGLPPLVVVAGLWVLHGSTQPGDPAPLSYVPLLNPLELGQCVTLAAIFGSVLRNWNWVTRPARWYGLSSLAFVALNGAIARASHFLTGVPFDLAALWASPRYQTAVSITWAVVALAVMVGGSRLRERAAWIAGTTLLAAVVAKLFIVDLAGIGTVPRIVSFIVVGVLILVIGYLSPLPPRAGEQPVP